MHDEWGRARAFRQGADADDVIDVVGFSIYVFSSLVSLADFINYAERKRAKAGESGRKFSAMIHALILCREKK